MEKTGGNMITLAKDKRGQFEVQLTQPDNSVTSIPLGRLTARQAENARRYVQGVIAAPSTMTIPDTATSSWLARAPQEIRKHLEWLGLVELASRQGIPTLSEWINDYISGRADLSASTVVILRKTERRLLAFFGEEVRIDRITSADAKDFQIWMKTKRKLSAATACLHCEKAKVMFNAAVRKGVITKNPFAGLRLDPSTNPRRLYFVTREEAEAVLRILPNAEWRLLFALCRYGGLRCPSEVTRLRWEDVDWARKRFTVHGPKTRRSRNGGIRQVPIFPELLPHFQAARREAGEHAEYVITPTGCVDARFSTYLRYRLRRAGIEPWPKFFQNLRSTRETELAEEFPLHVACAWIGNTKRIAAEHYLQVTEAQYEKAAGGKTADPAPYDQQAAIPKVLSERWTELPEDVREAIVSLASVASGSRS